MGGGYKECKRIWNSRVHDDWRRTGDVVVWCLHEDRVEKEDERGVGEKVKDDIETVKKRVQGAGRVVEKAFWKERMPMIHEEEEGWWEWASRVMVNGKKKEKRWWKSGLWS